MQSENNPGGIEIKVTGFALVKSYFEELLIGNASLSEAPHEKILRAEEGKHSEIITKRMLVGFEATVADADVNDVRALVVGYVSGYHIAKHE